MTVAELLSLISGALLLQLMVGIGWTAWRRRSSSAASRPDARSTRGVERGDGRAGWREFRVAQRGFEDASQSQCSFYLEPVDAQPLATFKPGQFLTFNLDITPRAPVELAASRTITRCYSLSDRPAPTHYRVTIKRITASPDHPGFEPGLSSNHFHDHVQVGDILRVKSPAGHFFLDTDTSVPVVLIGGGIGITPMMSMLRWCVIHQPQRMVHLYYGLRNSRDHAFKQPLEEMAASHPALQLHVVYSRPGESDLRGRDYQHEGHVEVDLLRRTLPPGRHQFYVCGPPAMMQTLVPALAAWGVPGDDIHYENFGPATVRSPTASAIPTVAGVEVKFQKSRRTLTWDAGDASLLDFAERHGIEVDSGCRSGSCGSCETRLLEGMVAYEQVPDFDVAQGHCLLCVGRPSSPLVLEL